MLTRHEVLQRTDNGREVFRHYLGHEPKAGRNFQNPFSAPQHTPSFNLYPNEAGEWRYKDFATSDEGSWLDLVMQLHGLDPLEAMNHVIQELGLEGLYLRSNPKMQAEKAVSCPTKSPRPIEVAYRPVFETEELSFWQQYGIDEQVLTKYQVRPITKYTATRADGSRYTISATVDNPLFAYDAGEGFVKVYAPKTPNKAFKFTWPTGKPDGYVFGRSQLRKHQPIILLAAGEKDAMALSAHGYAAVTVGSENVLISDELIAELKDLCDEVIICYDADETGRTRSKELSEEHGLRRVEWPADLAPYGKDAADFYRAMHQKQVPDIFLAEAIEKALASVSPESAGTLTEEEPVFLPTYPQAVYDNLPDYLRRACAPFDGHEKAVMLLSSLGVLSGCFQDVSGLYHQRRVGLNLYTFVSAPAASGKGALTWAQHLARHAHKQLLSESKVRRNEYEAEARAHKATGKGGAGLPLPAGPPPHRMLYLPADTTAAALMNALNDNDGRGIICETEADTLTTAMGGEHGKFADKLCKIFQHEPVPLMRKGESLHLELERPAVSVVLSGTPAQVPRLMPNAENGLMSRFLFYCFRQPHIWRSGAPNGRAPLEPYFDALGVELSAMMAATPSRNDTGMDGVSFTLSSTDWARLDAACESGLHEAVALAGDAGASSAYRLGLIAFRLIGLLTVLRCFEHGQAPATQVEADPLDVSTALCIVEIARAHTLHVLATLPSSTKPAYKASQAKFEEKAAKVAKAVELQQQGMSYRSIAEQLGVGKSQVGEWLNAKAA